MSNTDCWICGRPGAVPTRTVIGIKKPVCPEGQGCTAVRANAKPFWKKS